MSKLKTYTVTTTLVDGPMAQTPIGNHDFILDQPVAAGGTDKGPTPIDAFLSTISSCLGNHFSDCCSSKRYHPREDGIQSFR